MKSHNGATAILDQITDIDGEVFEIQKAVPTKYDFYLWRGWRDNETRRRASAYVLTREVADYLVRVSADSCQPDLPLTEGVLRQFRERLGIPTARDIAYKEWQQLSLEPPKLVNDVFGRAHLVYKEVPCKMGVDLAWGTPSAKEVGRNKGGTIQRPRFILTRELAATIRNWTGPQLELAASLPFDRRTLDRMRRALGLDWHDDVISWWAERLTDLMQMPPEEFVATHGKQVRTVRDQRHAIGHVRHRLNDADFVKLLSADWSDKKQGAKRRMGPKYRRLQTYRLAWRILKAAGQGYDLLTDADGRSDKHCPPDNRASSTDSYQACRCELE